MFPADLMSLLVGHRVWRRVLLVALVFSLATIFPSIATAGTYTVWACADGSGHRQPATEWKPVRVSNDLGHVLSSCGDSAAQPTPRLEAIAASAPTNPPTTSGVGWRLDAVTGTRIVGFDVWMVAVASSAIGMHSRVEILGPSSVYSLDAPPSMAARFGGSFANGPGTELSAYSEQNHQSYRGLSAPNVTLMAWCVAYCQSNEVGAGSSAGAFAAYRLRTAIDDPVAPTGSVTGLDDGVRVAAPIVVRATAADVGAGVREISLRVDDVVVDRATPAGDCADVDTANDQPFEYSRMQPCPSQHAADLVLSPQALGDGARHHVTVVAVDAAGAATVIASARVAAAAPPRFFASGAFFNPDLDVRELRRLNGANAGPARMRLSLVRKNGNRKVFRSRHIVSAKTRQLINGRLTTLSGLPIRGARVWLATAAQKGAWEISGRPLVTSDSGSISGRLPPGQPSRDVRLVYFPYSDSSENSQSPSVKLKVRGATTIRTDQAGYRNGETMRFSGRIATLPIARRKAVYLQVIVRGSWRTFDTTRADSRGRWGLRYRFTATRQPTVYRFRAVVPAEEQPVSWATGYSRALRVLVAP